MDSLMNTKDRWLFKAEAGGDMDFPDRISSYGLFMGSRYGGWRLLVLLKFAVKPRYHY
jgi:hypothetical protein